MSANMSGLTSNISYGLILGTISLSCLKACQQISANYSLPFNQILWYYSTWVPMSVRSRCLMKIESWLILTLIYSFFPPVFSKIYRIIPISRLFNVQNKIILKTKVSYKVLLEEYRHAVIPLLFQVFRTLLNKLLKKFKGSPREAN